MTDNGTPVLPCKIRSMGVRAFGFINPCGKTTGHRTKNGAAIEWRGNERNRDMRELKTMEEVVMEEQEVLTDYLTDAVYEIDGLTIPHDIKGFEIEQTKVKAVMEKTVLIKATGRVEVHLMNGEDAEDGDDAGLEMDAEFPFDATFTAPKTAFWDGFMVTAVEFHVNTDNSI